MGAEDIKFSNSQNIPTQLELSHKTFKCSVDSQMSAKPDYNYLSPELNSMLSRNKCKGVFFNFNIYWIFQECNYHTNSEKIMLCFAWNFTKNYLPFWKTTTLISCVFVQTRPQSFINLHLWLLQPWLLWHEGVNNWILQYFFSEIVTKCVHIEIWIIPYTYFFFVFLNMLLIHKTIYVT